MRIEQSIRQQLEEIASEICDHYCKYPGEYDVERLTEEEFSEKLVAAHCEMCPLVQFLSK